MVVRLTLAVTVSYALAGLLRNNDLLLMAPMTTLFVIQGSPFATVGASLQRMLGTCVGVALATVYVEEVSTSTLTFGIGMFAALLFARALPIGITGQMQVATGALFVLVAGNPGSTSGFWRVADVVIGGLVGIAAVFVLPPRPRLESAERAVEKLVQAQAMQLRRVGDELGSLDDPLAPTQRHAFDSASVALGELEADAERELEAAAESLRFRPHARDSAERLEWIAKEMQWLAGLNAQVRSISGAADRLYDHESVSPTLPPGIARNLLGACADLVESTGVGPNAPPEMVATTQDLITGALSRIAEGDAPVESMLESVSLLGRLALLVEAISLGAPGKAPHLETAA